MKSNSRQIEKDDKFGEWTVVNIVDSVKIHCRCSCGKERDINKYSLLNGRSTSCGHTMNKNRVKDLKDRRFGSLVVKKYLGGQRWQCLCDCGNICVKHHNHLLDGRAHRCKICGAEAKGFINIKGQRFGMLVAQRYIGNKNWECLCDCGNTKIVSGFNLRNNSTTSCGCKNNHFTREELENFSEKFKKENNRLPFLNEIAEGFGVTPKNMSYFISTRDAHNLINNSFSSVEEREIASLFKDIKDIRIGDRTIIKPYELDIYIPDKKLAIEFNGNYWHSEEQKKETYHQEKTIACAKKGIRLIHIFEYEWNDEAKQQKLKSMLLGSAGLVEQKRVYARKTEVKQIGTKECREFLNKNHLQGAIDSSTRYGCFDKETQELLGVMTFGKARFNTNVEYEIHRLCFKSNLIVVGGTEKMFKHFLRDYNPSSIITYSDISKFTGNNYLGLGFKAIEITKPNYIWYNNSTREIKTRYQTQKHKLLEQGLGSQSDSEPDIMKALGYTRIYDCGNIKLIWNKSR